MNSYRQRVKLLDVIGEGKGETIVKFKTLLKNPDPEVENPIIDEKFEIQNLTRHVYTGKVVLQGKLVKKIIYKAVRGDKKIIAHQTDVEPFTIDVSVPGLRGGFDLGYKKIYPINAFDDIHLEVHFLKICSDSIIDDKKSDDNKCSDKKSFIIFKNPALEKRYPCEYCDHCPHREKEMLKVEEKVLIKVMVIASRFVIRNILTEIPTTFHCPGKTVCKV